MTKLDERLEAEIKRRREEWYDLDPEDRGSGSHGDGLEAIAKFALGLAVCIAEFKIVGEQRPDDFDEGWNQAAREIADDIKKLMGEE